MECIISVRYILFAAKHYRHYTESFETDKELPNTINQTKNINQHNIDEPNNQNNQNISNNLSFKIKTIKVPITDQQSEIESIEIYENPINNVGPVNSQYEFLLIHL